MEKIFEAIKTRNLRAKDLNNRVDSPLKGGFCRRNNKLRFSILKILPRFDPENQYYYE
jgi:hypothetical protein